MLTTFASTRRVCRHRRPTPPLPVGRPGRLLVECLVAMLLLNATALMVVGLARGTAIASQRTTLTARAWATAVLRIERASAGPCEGQASTGGHTAPQLVAAWSERTVGPHREHHTTVQLTLSPLAGATTSALALDAAWSCP